MSIRVEDNKLLALILHLKEMLLQREASKIVKAKTLGLALFVVSHDQVFGLLGRPGLGCDLTMKPLVSTDRCEHADPFVGTNSGHAANTGAEMS